MMIGAVLEPKALCGSTSDTPPTDCGPAAFARRTHDKQHKTANKLPAKTRRRFTRPSRMPFVPTCQRTAGKRILPRIGGKVSPTPGRPVLQVPIHIQVGCK